MENLSNGLLSQKILQGIFLEILEILQYLISLVDLRAQRKDLFLPVVQK